MNSRLEIDIKIMLRTVNTTIGNPSMTPHSRLTTKKRIPANIIRAMPVNAKGNIFLFKVRIPPVNPNANPINSIIAIMMNLNPPPIIIDFSCYNYDNVAIIPATKQIHAATIDKMPAVVRYKPGNGWPLKYCNVAPPPVDKKSKHAAFL